MSGSRKDVDTLSIADAQREAAMLKRLPKDLVTLVERSRLDPGAPFEPAAIERLKKLRAEDPPTWERVRALLEAFGVTVTELDCQTRPAELGHKKRITQASRLVDLAERDCTLFHCGEEAFVEFEHDAHRQSWPVDSYGFSAWLRVRYFQESAGGAPNNEAFRTAIRTIEARARFQGPACEVYRRVGSEAGRLYLDLCNAAWQAIEIDATGWRCVDRPAVRFVRTRHMRALPEPERGGEITALRTFLNLASEDDFNLAVACLLAALRPTGPYPVLVLTGEQGSAKSTCAQMLRALVDPHEAALRAPPRNEQELFIAARNTHVLAFDNLSTVPAWLSDALCRLSTGAGFAARKLYTDDEESVISAARPVILNSIDAVVTRGDLADRALVLTLEAIRDVHRKPASDLWADFERVRPQILGALLDAMVVGLARLATVQLEALPRMADFAMWTVACEPGVFAEGAFLHAYERNREGAVTTVIEASLVAGAICGLMRKRRGRVWEGTATQLYRELTRRVGESVAKTRGWPGNAKSLSQRLKRLTPALRQIGITVEWRKSGQRLIWLSGSPEAGC